MVARRRGKRKSPSKGFVFEVSEEDVSPDNSESDSNEPESKILKTDSKFVESVVNALSNLENEKQTDNIDVKLCEKNPDENIGLSSGEILDCITPNVQFNKSVDEQSQIDFEDGELAIEDNIVVKDPLDQTIQIIFSNAKVCNLYKTKFLKFVNSFVELQVVKEDEFSITLQSDLNEWRVLDETQCLDNNLPNNSNVDLPSDLEKTPGKKKKRKKNKKDKELFILDTTPSKQENPSCAKYMTKFNIGLNDNNGDEVSMPNQICFNCDQNHSLKDCPLPKDFGKINMMRQKFKKDKQTSRYHLEEEQKYAHLKPGKISEALKDALGLKKNQLPPYVYQMRNLGYPPGWLEEAKFVYSNLTLFDTEGNDVKPHNAKKNLGLDAAKIIEYPGFNVPMEKDSKDEYRHFRVPPYSENYSKKAMIEYFEKEYCKQQDNLETQDMDIDIIEETTIEIQPLRTNSIKEMEKNVPSPSLVDLETQKLNLLAALEDSSSIIKLEDIPPSENKEPPPPGVESEEPADKLEVPLLSADEALSRIFKDDEKTVNEDLTSTKTVLNSTFGTPIIKSSSPYSRLPNPDNFMKDVSPVINFENLPNSTGKYEQMTGILQKVRNTMKNLQHCDSL